MTKVDTEMTSNHPLNQAAFLSEVNEQLFPLVLVIKFMEDGGLLLFGRGVCDFPTKQATKFRHGHPKLAACIQSVWRGGSIYLPTAPMLIEEMMFSHQTYLFRAPRRTSSCEALG